MPNLRVALFEKVVEEMLVRRKKVGGRKSVKEDTLILYVWSLVCSQENNEESF